MYILLSVFFYVYIHIYIYIYSIYIVSKMITLKKLVSEKMLLMMEMD